MGLWKDEKFWVEGEEIVFVFQAQLCLAWLHAGVTAGEIPLTALKLGVAMLLGTSCMQQGNALRAGSLALLGLCLRNLAQAPFLPQN
jgi:hypothetical protein